MKRRRSNNKMKSRKVILMEIKFIEGMSIYKWLEKLNSTEKGIVFTTIDKKLVKLLISMYKLYQIEGNVKFNNVDYPGNSDEEDLNRVHKVK